MQNRNNARENVISRLGSEGEKAGRGKLHKGKPSAFPCALTYRHINHSRCGLTIF